MYCWIDRLIEKGMKYYWNKYPSNNWCYELYADNKHEKMMMRKHLGYRLLDKAQDLWLWLNPLIEKPYWWFLYRFVPRHRYHVLKPRTLKPGYHWQGRRIFHAAFEELVSYVEEQTSYYLKEQGIKLENATKDQIINAFWSTGCDDREESSYDEGDHPFEDYGGNDKEAVNLYWWWTQERISPESAWDQFDHTEDPSIDEILAEDSREKYPKYWEQLDRCYNMDRELREKDGEMLIRLAKIAFSLDV